MSVWTDKRTRYEFGDFILEGGRRRLLRRGSDEPQALTAKSFDTLFYLIEHRGETVDKDTLLRTLWPGVIVEENSLTQVISSLRQVLGEAPGENRYIATVPRKGYRFVGEVTEPTALAGPEVTATSLGPGVTPTMAGPVAADARRSRRPIWLGAAALSVVVSVTGAFLLQRSRGGHSSPSATSAPPAIRTLAVLPFKPLLPTERDESLELGMTESMIARLGAHDGMTVRP